MRLSMMAVSIVLAVLAAVCYAGFVLYGARIDGERQKVRDKGLHPVTDDSGAVHASEKEEDDGNERNG